MSKNKNGRARARTVEALDLSAPDSAVPEADKATRSTGWRSRLAKHRIAIGTSIVGLLIALGVFAGNEWLPKTDNLTGKRTGWFGAELAKNAPSSWNPLALPPPSPTPQLAREFLYAGSRLLSSVDANASEIPPADLAVWRPSDGTWRILGGGNPASFGLGGDDPIQGDFDGDGKTDFSVVRPMPTPVMWYVMNSSTETMSSTVFSSSGDQPVPADYDGDSKTDLAVWRSGNQTWYIVPSSSTDLPPYNLTAIHYEGYATDVPVPVDFDGDGLADLTYWRPSNHTFYSKNSSDGQTRSVSIGSSGDIPVCADYDGDGKADFAVLANNVWKIQSSFTNAITNTTWLDIVSTPVPDVPVPNDYDGDGKADIATWRVTDSKGNPGYWYIRKSSDLTLRLENWGTLGDIPVPALYRR